jgi:hexosaminidase
MLKHMYLPPPVKRGMFYGMVLLPMPRRVMPGEWTFNSAGAAPVLRIDSSIEHEQGYRLSIKSNGIEIASRTHVGAFYANQTLKQLRRQFGDALPGMEIEDWPDFPARGVMLDISRNKVPTIATLFSLIDMLAEWKINQLQLYTEHTFAYSGHRTVWEHASPITAEEIRQLDQYCRDRFIDLVPNQNSFGHMERWLKHKEYQHLTEAIDGADTPWGFRWKGPFSICPTDPKSLEFLSGLYAELLPNFSSRLFNVGCDETFDIGQGRSKSDCDRLGVHRVYLNFVTEVNRLVRSNGKQMMFWGDVILHQPDLIAELPRNLIALQWGYEADHPFDKEGEQFKQAGVPFYVCPGTSTWNSIAGRTGNAIGNLKAAADSGMRHGAIGYLITDWGDNGHLQYQPVSYAGFAAGAAFSWCLESNANLDLAAVLNHHAFKDPTETLGNVAIDLGSVYRVCGKANVNGSALFRLLVPHPGDSEPEKGMTEEGFKTAEDAIDAAISLLRREGSRSGELRMIADEFENAANTLLHCISIGRDRLGLPAGRGMDIEQIIGEHRRLWLARNREGGLIDSARKLGPAGRR